MHVPAKATEPDSSNAPWVRPLKAVLLHGLDQPPTDLNWGRTVQRMIQQVNRTAPWRTHVVRLNPDGRSSNGHNPLLAELDADYLVVDVGHTPVLPVPWLNSLTAWAKQRQVVNAMISALGENGGRDALTLSPAGAYLRQLAERHGLFFLAEHPEEVPGAPEHPLQPTWKDGGFECAAPSLASSEVGYA